MSEEIKDEQQKVTVVIESQIEERMKEFVSALEESGVSVVPTILVETIERIVEKDQLAAAIVERQMPETAPETSMSDVLDEMEKALADAPLEEGVSKVEPLPEIQFHDDSLGSIIHNGKFFFVYPPVKSPNVPEDPLYLIVEKQAIGASLADAEKLMVFEWGLVRLKDRVLVDQNGKRVLAVIRAQF